MAIMYVRVQYIDSYTNLYNFSQIQVSLSNLVSLVYTEKSIKKWQIH